MSRMDEYGESRKCSKGSQYSAYREHNRRNLPRSSVFLILRTTGILVVITPDGILRVQAASYAMYYTTTGLTLSPHTWRTRPRAGGSSVDRRRAALVLSQ